MPTQGRRSGPSLACQRGLMVYAYAPNFTWNGIFSLPRGTENRSKYRYFDKIEGQSSHRLCQPAQNLARESRPIDGRPEEGRPRCPHV